MTNHAINPSKNSPAYYRALALSALHSDSSLSVRHKRYNANMAKARSLEAAAKPLPAVPLRLTHAEFVTACEEQSGLLEHAVFKCPMCDTLQSANDLIRAGAGASFADLKGLIGFKCVGRFTGKSGPHREKGRNHGCNWTLEGRYKAHRLEVVQPNGKVVPSMALATAAETVRYRSGQLVRRTEPLALPDAFEIISRGNLWHVLHNGVTRAFAVSCRAAQVKALQLQGSLA